MEKISEFVKYLKAEVLNNSLYLWGGQGELVMNQTPARIINRETNQTNAGRVLITLGTKLRAGADMTKAKYFDCSGLGCYWFLLHGLINNDTTAHGLFKMCDTIDKDELKAGDMVFKLDTKGRAVHVGYCVNDNHDIVESYGRDKGVIMTAYGKGTKWTDACRPRFNWE